MMSTELTVKFDTGNAAFDWGNGPEEAARALRIIAGKVSSGQDSGSVFDSNGNRIGEWSVEYPESNTDDEEEAEMKIATCKDCDCILDPDTDGEVFCDECGAARDADEDDDEEPEDSDERPECGHSACVQAWIESGKAECFCTNCTACGQPVSDVDADATGRCLLCADPVTDEERSNRPRR